MPLAPTRIVVVTGTAVGALYAAPLCAALQDVAPVSVVTLPDGETHKE